jgi:Tfp pilus assembly protein PilZ
MRAEGSSLTLFVPTHQPLILGSKVQLEIHLADSATAVVLSGTVRFRRTSVAGAEAGISVSFEGEEKRRAAEALAMWAGKDPHLGSAASVRRATAIRCLVRVRNERSAGEVKDLSTGGAFIAVARRPNFAVGMELVLQLEPLFAGLGGRRVAARVMWLGTKYGQLGFGARFVDEPRRVQAVLRKFLRRLGD